MAVSVLTGDIVASTALPHALQEDLVRALAGCAEAMEPWHGRSLLFTRQRGDGWQVVLARPELALRSALFFQSAVRALGKGLATRISIATDEGDAGPGPDLNSATGPAFVASGRGLDAMEPPEQICHVAGGALGAAVRLADHIAQGWTAAQARALHPMLTPLTPPRHADIARDLQITHQAVTQALDRAGFAPLSAALDMIEAAGT
ncbi:MarR family transcriptional regulator [Tropicimonas sp. IMCC34043]|uniref:MarR family transcriptional regulator n=1 Tax=Tropicimonas sp. IMCC34043 TaxID=2248760 RepID=UPI000E23252F|nr:MarR family transcriptional regulator [Tropicimonas sp. IMCC34043]